MSYYIVQGFSCISACVLSEDIAYALVLVSSLCPFLSLRLATAALLAPRVPSVMSFLASAPAKKGLVGRAVVSAPWATGGFLTVSPVSAT